MPITPADLIKTATPSPAEGQPGAEPENNPDAVQQLYELLASDPELATKVADLIESHFSGGENMPTPDAMIAPAGEPVVATPQASNETAVSPQMQQIMEQLGMMQKGFSDMQLEKALNQARDFHGNVLKKHLPIVGDMNEQALLNEWKRLLEEGPSSEDALLIAAMRDLMQGDTSLADRLLAHHAENAPAKSLPRVEGKGGSQPTGETPPPSNMRESNRAAKERVHAFFGGAGPLTQ